MEYVNDTGLPSVTDILNCYIDTRWFRKEHTDRGSGCHDWMACYALGLPHIGKVWNPLWNSYAESGKKWFDQNVKDVLMVEKRLKIDGLYTGQLDLVAILVDKRTALVDWKTSQAKAKTWKGQTAAYQNLVQENAGIDIDVRVSVRLRSEFQKRALDNYYTDFQKDLNNFNGAFIAYSAYM